MWSTRAAEPAVNPPEVLAENNVSNTCVRSIGQREATRRCNLKTDYWISNNFQNNLTTGQDVKPSENVKNSNLFYSISLLPQQRNN